MWPSSLALSLSFGEHCCQPACSPQIVSCMPCFIVCSWVPCVHNWTELRRFIGALDGSIPGRVIPEVQGLLDYQGYALSKICMSEYAESHGRSDHVGTYRKIFCRMHMCGSTGCYWVALQARPADFLASLQVLRSHSSVAVLFKAIVSGIAQCCNKWSSLH